MLPVTTPAVADLVAAFRDRFTAAGDPQAASAEQRYLKSDLHFFGVRVPVIRQTAKAFHREHRTFDRDSLVALAAALWETDWHELRSVGIALLELYGPVLQGDDMAFVESLLDRANTWAHVDWLAVHVAGSLVRRFPVAKADVSRWAVSPNFWLRRSALLALLSDMRSGAGDFALFETLAVPMLTEKEFFIRKAIGWILRDVSGRRPELTYAFLRTHRQSVSGLTLREGAKHLPAEMRADLAL